MISLYRDLIKGNHPVKRFHLLIFLFSQIKQRRNSNRLHIRTYFKRNIQKRRGWDKSPSLLIVFGLSSKTQWLSGLYYADFISVYSPTQLCGGGTTKSNSNELPISVPLSLFLRYYSLNLLMNFEMMLVSDRLQVS